MTINATPFEGLYVIEPRVFEDHRGFFYESYSMKHLEAVTGESLCFVQDNHSYSKQYVLRGMHFQEPPHDQVKIVRVVHGEVLDVVIDIRKSSKTFGQYYKIKLSATNRKQLYIPVGFAHGFLVLSETAEFVYKCSNFYHPESENGLAFDDPTINIDWGMPSEHFILSEKDIALRNNTIQNLDFYV
ncbi:MAG: dTDP-4-dehydrorhamnose 3,5-epimerase [Flammeovirgaceae bacterium]